MSKHTWRSSKRAVEKFLKKTLEAHYENNTETVYESLSQSHMPLPLAAVVTTERPENWEDQVEIESPALDIRGAASDSSTEQGDQSSDSIDDPWRPLDLEGQNHYTSDSEEDEPRRESLRDETAKWACQFNVTHSALNGLLKILQSHQLDVPASATTLLKTPKNQEVSKKSGGDYIYFGLAQSLQDFLSDRPNVHDLDCLELCFNIDGLPLHRSTKVAFWPILCTIFNVCAEDPIVIALFCANHKPTSLDFLTEFIEELLELIHTGVQIGEHLLTVGVHSIICDAPARAMVKGITQFNGFYGCDQCEVKGVYQGRMLFMENDCRLRTDESFRSQTNKLHHRADIPFCKLPIDMISQFPIDYMHQVNLGVTRKLLVMWTGSWCLKQARLAALHINRISSNLVKMKQYIPCEFVRKPRSLSDLAMWKASELRQFLLYTGPLALKDVLAPETYMNFLCLSVGVTLLMSEKFVPEHSDYACELLKHFVCEAQRLYGEKFVTYNVHSVIHLADVARRYGSLQNCSAYPFENYMQRLKRLVRSTTNPIVQVANRLSELKVCYVVVKQSTMFGFNTRGEI